MAICDANLVDSMPTRLTAYGGLDALVHAMESYVSVCATDYTKGEQQCACAGSTGLAWLQLNRPHCRQRERSLHVCDITPITLGKLPATDWLQSGQFSCTKQNWACAGFTACAGVLMLASYCLLFAGLPLQAICMVFGCLLHLHPMVACFWLPC
jgi:hypothetical protein